MISAPRRLVSVTTLESTTHDRSPTAMAGLRWSLCLSCLILKQRWGPTELVKPHQELTHPAVIPISLGTGQGLVPLALVTPTTGAVMTLDHSGVNGVVTPQLQPGFKRSLTRDDTPSHGIDSISWVTLCHWSLGESRTTATYGTTASPWGRVTTPNDLQPSRFIAGPDIGEAR